MKITADLSKGILTANGAKFPVSCNVRTLSAGTRGRAVKEVRHSIPDKLPYDPRPFPKGLWNITTVEWRDKYKFDDWEYGDVKIRTDAWQMVNVWELDQDGNYLRAVDKQVKDTGYLIHYSESSTTLGCLRVGSKSEANALAKFIQKLLDSGEKVQLEVA